MAVIEKLGHSWDGQKVNEIRQVLKHRVASGSKPTGPAESQDIWNTTSHKPEWWDGSAWMDPTARANHTGTQLAATISDFDTTVLAKRLDQFAAPTAAVAFNGQRATGLADPSSAQDAATQAYVLAQIQAALQPQDWKGSARVAVTTNVNTASPGATLDGVTMAANDRVLLTGQTTGSQNGLWVWNGAAVAMTRPTDFDASSDVTGGIYIPTNEGTSADRLWNLTTNDPIVLGTTTLTFVLLPQGTAYTAGNGLTLTTTTFAVNPVASGGISVAAGGVSVDRTLVPFWKTGTVGDGSATTGTITHNLGNDWPVVQFYIGNEQVDAGYDRIDTNSGTWAYAPAPSSGGLRWVAIG